MSVISRERINRIVHRITALATRRRLHITSQLLLAVGLAFVLASLGSIWRDSHIDLDRVGWAWIAGGLALTTCGVAAGGFIWLVILRRLGVDAVPHWAGVYFQGQLAKYIPGTVWQYVGRAALARTRGIPLRTVSVSVPAELGACAVAAGLVATLLLGRFAAIGGLVVFIAVIVDGRRDDGVVARILVRLDRRGVLAGARAAMIAAPIYVVAWLVIGTGFWLTARGLIDVSASELGTYAGTFCAAWLVGLLAVFAPGGIGIREAVLVTLLRGRIGSADAVMIAAASRAIATLADLAVAGLGILVLRHSSSRQGDTGNEDRRAYVGS
jgi:uncharacterized membrane protein YbhN (UPF0104 family)